LKKDQSVIRKGDSLWRETLRPACLLIEAVLPHMQEAGYGRLIHLIRHSWLGAPDAVPFSMSQGAVISLTRSLALKHAADGITVNCLVKGVLGKAQEERERRLQQVQ